MVALYDAVIIKKKNTDYIMYFLCVLAIGIINSARFLPAQRHQLGSAFVAHTETFGLIVMR